MNFMPQPRYNPRTQRDVWYYRIKESFRDLTGRVRSRIMLNVGFIDEPSRSHIVKYYDTKDIGDVSQASCPVVTPSESYRPGQCYQFQRIRNF